MSFGKRQESTGKPRPVGGRPDAHSRTQRLQALRDDLRRLLDTAVQIADAIRAETAVAMPVLFDEPNPETGPLVLTGFHTHFAEAAGSRIVHRALAYRQPGSDGPLDPNAQYHLHQLTGRAMEINLYCQRAEMDGALGVALQSPSIAAMIDAVIVPAAFFTALVDNMIAGADPSSEAARRANRDSLFLLASDKMLEPSQLHDLVPVAVWPIEGVEVEIAPHEGDAFINGVYFPAEHARLLLGETSALISAAA